MAEDYLTPAQKAALRNQESTFIVEIKSKKEESEFRIQALTDISKLSTEELKLLQVLATDEKKRAKAMQYANWL